MLNSERIENIFLIIKITSLFHIKFSLIVLIILLCFNEKINYIRIPLHLFIKII